MDQSVWQERRNKDARRPDDVRNEWERDYARLIHSAAFRRLQSKTQVLGLGESDFYRTRLTHSMEVAQIGVGIVRWLRERHQDIEEINKALPASYLINSICLAHDIGHPPFGHGGEVALNICMRDYGGFEGNGQTLRILSRLDKYTDGYGMNPTRRLLLGVLKYPASYSAVVFHDAYGEICTPQWLSKARQHKPPKCYLDTESDIVDFILSPLDVAERSKFVEKEGFVDKKHSRPVYKGLDTSIMELADDISYSLHDLEDAISLGMVTKRDWDDHNASCDHVFEACGESSSELSKKLFSDRSYERKKAIGDLVHKLIVSTYVSLSGLPGASTPIIKWNAFMEESCKELMRHMFQLVVKKVIQSPSVQQLEFKGQKIVIELFNALNSDPQRLLPASTFESYERADSYDLKVRVVCDYISGMTDDYAARLYEKIYYPHKGSIFDRL